MIFANAFTTDLLKFMDLHTTTMYISTVNHNCCRIIVGVEDVFSYDADKILASGGSNKLHR